MKTGTEMARVLIVEDEGLLRELAVEEFTDAGFSVEEAANGDDALALLQASAPFDVLFTDVRMPGRIDGWELGRLAGDLQPGIRVIYATGYAERSRPLTASEHFISKPYRCEQIIHMINAWCATT